MNTPGSGMADDKLVHAHVDELVRFYSTRSRCFPRCPRACSTRLDRLDGLVVKPRGEMGGEDVVIWRDADAATRERVAGGSTRSPASGSARSS